MLLYSALAAAFVSCDRSRASKVDRDRVVPDAGASTDQEASSSTRARRRAAGGRRASR